MRTTTRLAAVRAAAAAGALAVGLAGLGLGTTAYAEDPKPAAGNFDPDAKGTLHIHKREAGSQKTAGTANNDVETTGTGVADVVFTAFPIEGLDLKTQPAWDELSNFTVPGDACGADFKKPTLTLPKKGAVTFGAGIESTKTGKDGEATIGNMPVAAYLVCETASPSVVKTKAAPFIVTMPSPYVAKPKVVDQNNKWLTDVHVFPKNTVVTPPVKTVAVDDEKYGVGVGDQVTFTVTQKVPSIDAGDQFSHFVFGDKLDTNLTDGTVKSVELGELDENGAFTKVADIDAANYVKKDKDNGAQGAAPSVGFTKDGLADLKMQANKHVRVTFTAKVQSVPQEAGVISNTAQVYVKYAPGQNPPETPPTTPPGTDGGVPPTDPHEDTNKVLTNWGDLIIRKVDNLNQQNLNGAKFKVFRSADDNAADGCGTEKAKNPKTGQDYPAIQVLTKKGEVKDEFTTGVDGPDGQIDLAGLFVSSENVPAGVVKDKLDVTERCYVLEETAAPAGYVLPGGENALSPVKVNAGASVNTDLTITNKKQDVPQLPLTGASGQVLMMAGGAALVLLAGGTVAVARRRQAED